LAGPWLCRGVNQTQALKNDKRGENKLPTHLRHPEGVYLAAGRASGGDEVERGTKNKVRRDSCGSRYALIRGKKSRKWATAKRD